MSGNSIGQLFKVTTFGESHGPAIGAVVDGCPPGMTLTAARLETIRLTVSFFVVAVFRHYELPFHSLLTLVGSVDFIMH